MTDAMLAGIILERYGLRVEPYREHGLAEWRCDRPAAGDDDQYVVAPTWDSAVWSFVEACIYGRGFE